MTLQEVKSLLDAGFTREEILSFEQPVTAPAITPEITPAEPASAPAIAGNKPESETEKVTEAVPDKALPDSPVITALNENISKLIKTIQSSNLANNSIDKPANADITKQVDTIMESIIRPIKEVQTK